MSYLLNYNENSKVIERANGAFVYINGRKYIDTCLGNGTHILGHPNFIRFEGSTLFGSKALIAERYSELLNRYTGFDRFVLCNTGSEATMRAIRISRAYTGRKKIAIFEGGWHGSHDMVLDCLGIADDIKNLTIRLPYDDSALDEIKKGEFALVLIEPIQGSLPQENKDFLVAIQNVCKDSQTLFGLDEVISGFRIARGGAKELFQLDPDIVTYGKSAGGGFPIGIVAGKTEVMDIVKKGVFLGGTFSGNPITLFYGYQVLSRLTDDVYKTLNEQGQHFRDKVKLHVVGVGSFNRIVFTGRNLKRCNDRDKYENQEVKKMFYDAMFEKGIYVGSNGLQFLSVLHSQSVVDQMIKLINSI